MPPPAAVRDVSFLHDGDAVYYDWLLRDCNRTFSPFHRGVITTYALEVGATGDGDYREHSFSAFRAARCPIHWILRFARLTRNSNFCSSRIGCVPRSPLDVLHGPAPRS